MSRYSSDFVKTVALIAARAQIRWQFLTPEHVVEFAWASCNMDGDASIDDRDLVRHFERWLEDMGFDLPSWMV